MVIKRIISGVILVGIILGVIFVNWLCGLAVTAFIILGLYEFFGMLERKGICTYKYFGTLLGAVIPLSIMLRFVSTPRWELLFIVVGLLALILMQFKRRQNEGVIVNISTTLFGILYISWFFSFLIKIRYLPGGTGFLASILLITKLGDIGAYFVGSRFGKAPLFPRISPKKTVEGSLAGLFFSILAALACQPLLNFSYLHLFLVGLCLGTLGQLGDLSESLIKRDCGVKDSGKLLPGMGGILDEIDSLLFNAPAFYFYISTVIKNY
jgi:phosphatidate cytidylyltransferase